MMLSVRAPQSASRRQSASPEADWVTRPPGLGRLQRGLGVVARRRDAGHLPIRVLARQPADLGSSFATEVVTCALDGREVQLFCKYGLGDRAHRLKTDHASHGHRGGVEHEAAVYREVLEPLGMSHARFFGAYREAETGQTWLILENLARGIKVGFAEPGAMPAAARWIGRFHAATQRRVARLRGWTTYDADYYRGWALRTARFTRSWPGRRPWLDTLCLRFGPVAAELAAMPRCVVHGEFYPHNILFQNRQVYPVDWESAAIGAGLIDLAALTELWAEDMVRRCKAAYRRARWPGGSPIDFDRGLGAARLYLAFRWLGEQRLAHPDRRALAYLRQLRTTGEQLGVI